MKMNDLQSGACAAVDAPWSSRLALPVFAAPMLLISGVELVVAACNAGVVGCFPTANCRTTEQLDAWLVEITNRIDAHEQASGRGSAPFCANLIVHPSNARAEADLAVLVRHGVELVVTSVGNPQRYLGPLHDAGCQVYCDVASLRHAEKAIASGVDGLVLLTAGSGGQTGHLNPFGYARAVRRMWDGPIVLAGAIADGWSLWAARSLGCTFGYMGTRFAATRESMAVAAYKDLLVDSTVDDLILTRAKTGLDTNLLRASVEAAGIDLAELEGKGPARFSLPPTDGAGSDAEQKKWRMWKDVWSAGHGVGGIDSILSVEVLVAQTRREFLDARRAAAGISPDH